MHNYSQRSQYPYWNDTIIHGTSRLKSCKDIEDLNKTVNQCDLIDIYRTSHPKKRNTVYSDGHEIFFKTEHILGHKKVTVNFKWFKSYNEIKL